MSLDARTLLQVLTLCWVVQAAILIYVSRIHQDYGPARLWGLGSALVVPGLALVGLRDLIPFWASGPLSSSLLLAGRMVMDCGVIQAAGRRPPWRVFGLACAVSVAVQVWFWLAEASFSARVLAFHAGGGVMDAWTAWACLTATGRSRSTMRALGLILSLFLLSCGWRVLGLAGTDVDSILAPVLPQVQFLAASIAVSLSATALMALLPSQRLQELIQASEERFRAVVEQSQDAIFMHDEKGRFHLVNQRACESLGYTREELLNLGVADVDPDFVARKDPESIWTALPLTFETRHRRKDGSVFPVEVRASRVDYGQTAFIHGAARDITERKRLEALKAEVDRMIRHDLRSPLAGIIHLPKILIDSNRLCQQDQNALLAIEEAGRQLLRLLNSAGDISRMESGSYVLKPRDIDLLALTERIMTQSGHEAGRKGLGLALLVDGQPPGPQDRFTVQGDDLLCSNMLANLLANAVEASPPSGAVLVIFSTSPRELRITNQGEVPLAIRDTFFEKYVTSGKPDGSGIGTYSANLAARSQGWGMRLDVTTPRQTSIIIDFEPLA